MTTTKVSLIQAMARQEGFGVPGAPPTRNHNPGDLEFGKFASAHGAVARNGRWAVFPDDETGFAAMRALLATPKYSSLTIHQAIYTWLGYSLADAAKARTDPNEPGNYPATYVANVCKWSGLAPDTIVSTVL